MNMNPKCLCEAQIYFIICGKMKASSTNKTKAFYHHLICTMENIKVFRLRGNTSCWKFRSSQIKEAHQTFKCDGRHIFL